MKYDFNLRLFDGEGAASPASPTRPSEAVSEEEEERGNGCGAFRPAREAERNAPVLTAARAHRAAAAQRYVQEQTETWSRAAGALSERCPGFDLHAALADASFCAMLRAGVPLENAYFALHADELLRSAVCRASRQAETRVAEHIRVRGARPGENGLGSGGGILVRPDVSRMSRADRADIARRAARGEHVKLHL